MRRTLQFLLQQDLIVNMFLGAFAGVFIGGLACVVATTGWDPSPGVILGLVLGGTLGGAAISYGITALYKGVFAET